MTNEEMLKLADEWIVNEKQWSWWQHWIVMRFAPKLYIRYAFAAGYAKAKMEGRDL